MPTAMRFYRICAILGTLIIFSVVSLSWLRINQFEENVSIIFEGIVTSNLEIDGLKQEMQHIDKVLQMSSEQKNNKDVIAVDEIAYTDYEVERLKNDKSNILLHIKEKELDLVASTSQKRHVMNEVRILFVISLLFLVLGTLLAAFGYLAWYFRFELFEDRRKKPR
ncbi:MAG: hypothetical protein OQL06_02505 [Gammaproteobacteria bacterium]|nr:hypothetical protein [Gammaproteobacteria bacterium]